jgi:hypothetical protein
MKSSSGVGCATHSASWGTSSGFDRDEPSVLAAAALGRVDRAAQHLAAVLVPEVHADAIAVDDRRDRIGQALGDEVAAAGVGDAAGQIEQRARLLVAALGLLLARPRLGQRGRAVERGRGVARVDLQELALLREERGAGLVHGDQRAVVVAVRAHRRDQPVVGVRRGVAGEEALGDRSRLLVVEALVVAVHVGARGGAHREQVARRAHLDAGSIGDARQRLVEVAGGDEVRRRREDALQALRHRLELLAHGGDLLGRVGRLLCGRLPRDAVLARGRAVGLAGILLDGRRRQPEEHRGLGEQPRRPLAVVAVAREALVGEGAHLGVARAHLDRLERRGDAEALARDRDAAQQLLGRSEPAQHGGVRRARQALDRVLADVAGEVLVAGHLRAGVPERNGLVVGDPVADVEQLLDRALAAGLAQQARDRLGAGDAAHAIDEDSRQRAREVHGGSNRPLAPPSSARVSAQQAAAGRENPQPLGDLGRAGGSQVGDGRRAALAHERGQLAPRARHAGHARGRAPAGRRAKLGCPRADLVGRQLSERLVDAAGVHRAAQGLVTSVADSRSPALPWARATRARPRSGAASCARGSTAARARR